MGHQHETRRDRIRGRLKAKGIDALLVTDFVNVTYLTGFTGDDSFLILGQSGEVLVTDFRYVTQLEEECPGLELYVRKSGEQMAQAVAKVLRQMKVSKLAVEADSITLSLHHKIAEQHEAIEIVPTTGWVAQLRAIKSRHEVDLIREAIAVAEKAFQVIRAALRGDETEKSVADKLEHHMRIFGAECGSFPAIVATGPRAALPHARPGQARIDSSPLLLIDWGAKVKGYCSDMTRVLFTGKIPPRFEKIYNTVLEAQQKAIAAIRPGITVEEVDRAARAVIEEAGFGKQFGHGLGHGVGLQVHELPRLGPGQNTVLKAGMVVTVEPGIYIPGRGGVRIEDDVLVTRSGHEVISSLPKNLEEACVSW